jgi:hypothetical protein
MGKQDQQPGSVKTHKTLGFLGYCWNQRDPLMPLVISKYGSKLLSLFLGSTNKTRLAGERVKALTGSKRIGG